MMKNIVCIVCPNGCALNINDNGEVSGNLCPKGIDYAKTELSHPIRTLTTTVKTTFSSMPYVPVRTASDIPKEMMLKAVQELGKLTISDEHTCGDVVVKNLLDLGCDIIITTDLKKEGI